jgi:arylsulfatase A-like enzyme
MNEDPHEEHGYLTDLLSERAAAFVNRQEAGHPFLLSLHYSAPHWPWLTREDEAESRRIANQLKHVDGGSLAIYQRMITQMDEGIGRVLDSLSNKGLENDTLVVFTSDNGGERFSNNWPFVGQKMDLLEGGIRVPVLARWPAGIAAGATCDLPHMTMDWTATMLDAAGVAAHPDYALDGRSLMPLLKEPAQARWPEGERDLAWRMTHRAQRALVRGDRKYLRMDDHEYLFDIAADPRERANMAQREPARLVELRAAWEAWNATLPPVPADAGVSLIFEKRDVPVATF